MHTFAIQEKNVTIFPSASSQAPIIYLNTFSNEGVEVFEAIQAASSSPFHLAVIRNLCWNHDMAPWDSPPAFKNGEPCTGGADDYLRLLTKKIIPATEKEIPGVPRWRGIAGYSLAGLFALYAIYHTDLFSRVGSISGSLWFPGIKEFIFSHELKRLPDCVYFSLGDKESKTRNPILKSVQQNTQDICTFYKTKGIDTVFQLNPGNHYDHAAERTAAGICWLLSR